MDTQQKASRTSPSCSTNEAAVNNNATGQQANQTKRKSSLSRRKSVIDADNGGEGVEKSIFQPTPGGMLQEDQQKNG